MGTGQGQALPTLRQQTETVHRRTSEFVARDLRKRLDQLAEALQQLDPANTELREPAEQAGESGTERSAGQDDHPR
jgi:ppGpp synthetase/RelA/SpoT-type nucleotidyltranferase